MMTTLAFNELSLSVLIYVGSKHAFEMRIGVSKWLQVGPWIYIYLHVNLLAPGVHEKVTHT